MSASDTAPSAAQAPEAASADGTSAPPQTNGQEVEQTNGDSPDQANGDRSEQTNGDKPEQNNGNKPEPKEKGPIAAKSSDLKGKVKEKKGKVKDKTKPAGGFDKTPLPRVSSGYTVKFTFIKASNLPIADIETGAADPFIHATLTTSVPGRHKEDPLLVHRTRTIRRTTEPEWNEEWIVANIPSSGFSLKCRLYDEDWPDHNDRLGNVTVKVSHLDENWRGFGAEGRQFEVKKRMGSKRAYFIKGVQSTFSKEISMTPILYLKAEVLGKSDPPHGHVYTVGPTRFIKHFSPMIGRLAGIKVNKDEQHDAAPSVDSNGDQTKKYDFQASEIQLAGPVPPELYHRYVEFRPFVSLMFSSSGLRGRVLNKALHKQHSRVYNYDSTTEYGTFEPCSDEASLQFLKMVHFDEGGRVFTYVLTLDGLMRFTETGKEFGIDLLSKHTMHSDVATYIACSGEFFIRRLAKPDASEDPEPEEPTHPDKEIPGGPPHDPPPENPKHYQLIIDNDSGTYRPDKSILPKLKEFLEHNLPGLGIIAMHWEEEELQKLKEEQAETKKKEGKRAVMVLNRSPSSSSFSSDDESRLNDIGIGNRPFKSKKERALDAIEDPSRLKGYLKGSTAGSSSAPKPEGGEAVSNGGEGVAAH